jgi:regulator of cell morphogenesis and NO signaling
MSTALPPVRPEATLADLATTRPGAARVFHRHGLDFCCGGRKPLAQACQERGLDPAVLLAELAAEQSNEPPASTWAAQPIEALIDHLLSRFHEAHRAELPRLIESAQKVERVHADKPDCPRGLAAHLTRMTEELEEHMEKEEQVLFPMFRAGRGRSAGMPVQVMELEHQEHAQNLQQLRRLAHDFQPPAEACNTWRALYLALDEFEAQLKQHIHLENNLLFPRGLRT